MNNEALKELVEAGIIDQNKADQISLFFEQKRTEKPSRIFLVFAILGALLIGVGIFSIMAFNWSAFSQTTKTIIAFTPLILAQGLCLFTLAKKETDSIWYESVSTILIFAFGGALILISELYPKTTYTNDFIIIWALLSIPVIYLLRSSMASILSTIGVMVFTTTNSGSPFGFEPYLFIPLFLAISFHYYKLLKSKPASNFTLVHHTVFWLCLLACITSLSNSFGNTIPFAFLFMGNLTLILSHLKLFQRKPLDERNNVLYYLSILGIFIAVVFYSFHDNWQGYFFKNFKKHNFFTQPFFFSFIFLCLTSFGIIAKEKLFNLRKHSLIYIFIPALIALFLGKNFPIIAVIIFNVIGLIMGLSFVLEGNRKNHLGILNIGLLMILILIFSRAMDLDMNNAWKGVVFVMLGLGFFLANYFMIKKRKSL